MISTLRSLLTPRHPLRLAWHHFRSFLAALRFGFPARKLTIIGITGTDGKTTSVGMTAHILQKAGIRVGALSTAFFQIDDVVTWNATQKTSPSPFVIQRFLRDLVSKNCTHAVLEYSSHGLVQGRVAWTWPKVAAITNTSAEHLDYHGTMRQYREDKGILFDMLLGEGTKVLHREDETLHLYRPIPSSETIVYATHPPEYFTQEPIGSGTGETHLWSTDVSARTDGTTCVIQVTPVEGSGSSHQVPLSLRVPGLFNIENALCAMSCTLGVGVSVQTACAALESFGGVPGRMEKLHSPAPFSVYIDFTVTPVAYEKTLSALRAILPEGKRLLVLTGSCGDRMKEKRPLVGKIVSQFAHEMVVTNEDPYTENPETIIDEVWAGVDQSATVAHRLSDRREAIALLFSKAQPGDIVALCGKGSDTTMWVAQGQVPWNEKEIALELLKPYEA